MSDSPSVLDQLKQHTIVVAAGVAPDDAAAQLVSQLAAFIKKRARPVTTAPPP